MEIQFVSQLDRDLRACKLRTWPLPLLLVELHVLARPKANPVRLPNISSESFSRIHQLCCVKVETLLYKDGSWFEKLCLKLSDIFPPLSLFFASASFWQISHVVLCIFLTPISCWRMYLACCVGRFFLVFFASSSCIGEATFVFHGMLALRQRLDCGQPRGLQMAVFFLFTTMTRMYAPACFVAHGTELHLLLVALRDQLQLKQHDIKLPRFMVDLGNEI